jgi:hypothetical protein
MRFFFTVSDLSDRVLRPEVGDCLQTSRRKLTYRWTISVSIINYELNIHRPKEILTVGKYPNVKTLNKLVLPQAPSPIMTSFLKHHQCMPTPGKHIIGLEVDQGSDMVI